jgi:hypothetical protein
MFQLSSYVYTHRAFLDQQCWFEPKFSLTGKKFQSNIKRGRKKIDENNDKEKVPRKSEKMPKYMPNLLHLQLTLSIMCVKDIIAKKKL